MTAGNQNPPTLTMQMNRIPGREGGQFYTQQKVVSTRWFGEGVGDVWKK